MSTAPHAKIRHAITAALCALLAAGATAHDDPFDGSKHVDVTLTSPTETSVPNQAQFLVLTLDHAQKWHTYYPGRNDTGMGTTVTIDPVEGLTFAEPVFETPERYLAPGNILDHVYHGTAHIYIPYKADPTLAGESRTVTVSLDFLVCKDLCLPGSSTASVDLNFATEPKARGRDNAQRAIALKLPRPLARSAITTDNDEVTFTLPGAASYTFIPHNDSAEFVNLLDDGHQDTSTMTLTLKDPSAADPITGRLRVTLTNGTTQDYDVEHPRDTSNTSPITHNTNTQGDTP